MANDPVTWISKHWKVGIDLREECRGLLTAPEAEAWHNRELRWADELKQGVAARSPRDVERVVVLDSIPFCALPPDHPWHAWYGKQLSPFDYHARRLEEVKKIEAEWREAHPSKPKLKKIDGVDPDEFFTWFSKYAAEAATNNQRISREQNKSDAEINFECSIPGDWVTEGRDKLLPDHPFHRKGRPRSAK